MVAIPRSLPTASSVVGFLRKAGQRLKPEPVDTPAFVDLSAPPATEVPVDAFGPPHLLAASGILASEYYAGQARAAEVTGSEEWIRTPSCNIARDEMAAQGVCDGPDDPLGAVSAPAASYAPLLTGVLAAVAVGAAAGGGGGSGGSRTASALTVDAGGGGSDVAGHVTPLSARAAPEEASPAEAAAAAAESGAGAEHIDAGVLGTAPLAFDVARLDALEAAARHGDAPRVDGTAGIDTLSLVGHAVTLDFDALSRSGVRFSSIEKVDLAGGGNRLVLGASDVLELSGTDLFNAGSGWSGLGTHVERHQLVVEGGAGDTLQVGAGWQATGMTAQHDGHAYAVFDATDSMAQLLVASTVSVIG